MSHIVGHISPPKATAITLKKDRIKATFEISPKSDRKKYSFKLHFPKNNETLFILQNRKDRITAWSDSNHNDRLDPEGLTSDNQIMNTRLVNNNFVYGYSDVVDDNWKENIVKPKKVRKEIKSADEISSYLEVAGSTNVQNLKKNNFFDMLEGTAEISINISTLRRFSGVSAGGDSTYLADSGVYFRLYISKDKGLSSAWFNSYSPLDYTGIENYSEPSQ